MPVYPPLEKFSDSEGQVRRNATLETLQSQDKALEVLQVEIRELSEALSPFLSPEQPKMSMSVNGSLDGSDVKDPGTSKVVSMISQGNDRLDAMARQLRELKTRIA